MKNMNLIIGLFTGILSGTALVSAEVSPGNCPYGGGYGMMGMMSGYGGYGTGMVFSWVLYLAILALIIAGIYWLVKSVNKKR